MVAVRLIIGRKLKGTVNRGSVETGISRFELQFALSVLHWAPFVAHTLRVFHSRGTQWNLLVSVSSQCFKGKSGAVLGADALVGLNRA